MKKILLTSLLALGLLASCGGEPAAESKPAASSKPTSSKHTHKYVEDKTQAVAATCTTEGKKVTVCECGDKKETKVEKVDHKYVDDPTGAVAPTCQADGKSVQKCSVCGNKKETVLPKGAHTWGAASAEAGRADGKCGYKTRECTTCHTKDLFIDAADANAVLTGSKKSASDNTVKLSANGDHIDYTVTIPTAMTNVTVAVNGWVDYFKDGSNNNEARGFFSRKSGEGANVEVKLNDTAIEITNHKTYEEMGMQSRDDGTTNSTFALCEMGTVASIAAGDLTITYTRLESYNLNIDGIHFLYK